MAVVIFSDKVRADADQEALAQVSRRSEFFDWIRTDVCAVERQGSNRYVPL